MPRALLRAIVDSQQLVSRNVTEQAVAATTTTAADSLINSGGDSGGASSTDDANHNHSDGNVQNNPALRLIHWVSNFVMTSLQELVQDSHGEVSTLKVTILAVASIHVVALVRCGRA